MHTVRSLAVRISRSIFWHCIAGFPWIPLLSSFVVIYLSMKFDNVVTLHLIELVLRMFTTVWSRAAPAIPTCGRRHWDAAGRRDAASIAVAAAFTPKRANITHRYMKKNVTIVQTNWAAGGVIESTKFFDASVLDIRIGFFFSLSTP